ncbi:MAG: SpoIIE family protein phosphatase [Oscillospiraceae bacterium]|nr:SpoIIE family protein phosphatase [Oscillospiraceae bacterium]
MKIIRGHKLGGLQQKIFNLVLIFLLALVGVFVAISIYQQNSLSRIVGSASLEQQTAITDVSEQAMQGVLENSLTKTTALQAYIAGDLFDDVRTDVLTLQTLAAAIFEHPDVFAPHPFSPPDRNNDGIASVQVQSEEGVDPNRSQLLPLAANMSEIMLSMFQNSEKLSSCFVATADGNILYVDDRAGYYFNEDGSIVSFDVRARPWYQQAAETGELIFTGVELDAFTDIPGLVCAAPVYSGGELVAVVGADIFLTAIQDYVNQTSSEDSFVCVISDHGQVLFSPQQSGIFRAVQSGMAPDLRQSENSAFGAFITQALSGVTGLKDITVDGTEYYMTGAPMETVDWAVISVVEKELTYRPTAAMLESFDQISGHATEVFESGARNSQRMFIILTAVLILLAIAAALFVAGRIVKPVEHMTERLDSLSASGDVFEMEDIYRTGDEIEVLAETFASISRRAKDYIRQITEITAEKERIGTELALATRIQADMLPNTYPAFPDRKEFDIYATMDPAREVGGDFYDYFLVDDDHLCMLIADVSGKGIPAALFMMASRIILASNAKQGRSPAEILRSTNDAICQNNREEMFVTVWLGILEISTGKLTAANAGHEYPVLMQSGGRFELYKDRHGFVIGGMADMKYTEYELQLTPGSRLFLYTDGVPEAADEENGLFGIERMLAALNADPGASPKEMLQGVRKAVDDFVQDAEQFDDLTMLGLEYRGCSAPESGDGDMAKLELPAKTENLPDVLSFLESQLEQLGCPAKALTQISIAAEEIFVNIASYAYGPEGGNAAVLAGPADTPDTVRIVFQDEGTPFDPTQQTDPDVTLSAEERNVGGLGIFMTRKLMDDVKYEYRNGKNTLTLEKRFPV